MKKQPFYHRDGERFLPTPAGRGPWSTTSLHGRVVIGLLGAEIERRHSSPDYLISRLTVDMYRLPDSSPVTIETRVVRDGKRIKVVDAEFISNGVSMARATAQLLLKTDNPPGNTLPPPDWRVPSPLDLPEPEPRASLGGMWRTRRIEGAMGVVGMRKAWISEARELIDGLPLTPFTRVAVSADITSPFANGGDQGLHFINTDVTLYLHREPKGEWIGYEVMTHAASDGIAIGQCRVHDETGLIGLSSVTALAQKTSSAAAVSRIAEANAAR
jgi:hypothetical protein